MTRIAGYSWAEGGVWLSGSGDLEARNAGLSGCSSHRTTMRRTRTVASCGPLFVVFAAPQAVLTAISARLTAFFDDRAAGAVGPRQGFAPLTAAVSLTRSGKEDFGLALTHRRFLPRRTPQGHGDLARSTHCGVRVDLGGVKSKRVHRIGVGAHRVSHDLVLALISATEKGESRAEAKKVRSRPFGLDPGAAILGGSCARPVCSEHSCSP